MIDRMLMGAYGIGLASLMWISSSKVEPRVVVAGDKAPSFSVTTEGGRKVSRDRFGGKLLVVNFWASWCRPCLVEMPSLNQLAGELGPQGVTVLAVSIDEKEGPYRQLIERLRPGFLSTRDPGGELASEFGTFMVPETYVLDRKGRVLRKYIEARNWMEPALLSDFETLLRQSSE